MPHVNKKPNHCPSSENDVDNVRMYIIAVLEKGKGKTVIGLLKGLNVFDNPIF